MDSDTPQPLTIEEAKARLRVAAEKATPTAWLRAHPLRALTVAVVGGFVAARMRLPSIGGFLLAEKVIAPILFGAARGKENSRD